MLDNIGRIEGYLAGLDREALEANGQARDAIERCLERICEAAVRLGDRAAELLPGQPWPDIRGLGNWLRHAYDRVSFDVIWDTVQNDLPPGAIRLRKRFLDPHERKRSERRAQDAAAA